ncbi:MAG TPA: NUDIX domain-containing protein [Candidatus Paceibacterota bacterium]|nr:NUDIX domain-containing protein [Candidatus Paceibacterota bacterium]
MSPNFNIRPAGDAAVLAIIVSNRKTLIIREPDREDPKWKFPGGTVEREETISQALVREIADESGFKIPCQTNNDGTLVLGNDSVMVECLDCVPMLTKHGAYDQYQFLILVQKEQDILYLDGQIRKEDDDETIETRIFEFDSLEKMPDFLWKQLKMLRKGKARLAKINTAAS